MFDLVMIAVLYVIGISIGSVAAMESDSVKNLPTERARHTAIVGQALVWPLSLVYWTGWLLWKSPKLIPMSSRGIKYLAGGVSDIKSAKKKRLGLPDHLPRATIVTKKET